MEFVKKGGKVWGRGWLSERRVGEVRSVEGDEDGAGPKWNNGLSAYHEFELVG